MKIELGKKCEDSITGFVGIATGYCQYLSGCNQVLLTPRVDSNGSKVESHWIDEQRLVIFPNETVVLNNGENPGFGKPAPKNG